MKRREFIISAIATGTAITLGSPAWAASRSGNFKGDAGHTVSGGVTLNDDGTITMASNFSFDGAPDPRVSLGKKGKHVKGTDFSVLKKNSGSQTYKAPANLKAKDYDSVIIWCRKYSVQLGHAKIR